MRIKKNGVTINLTESDIKKLDVFLLTEKVSSTVQQGDTWCDIICKRKIASVGSNGDIVKHIQHALAKGCGDYGPYNPTKGGGGMSESCSIEYTGCDGKFRKETKKAVEEFQKDANTYHKKGLKVDGIVGANTLKAMCDILGCSLTKEACGKCNCNEDKKQLPKKDDPGQLPDEDSDWIGYKYNPEWDKIDCTTLIGCMQRVILTHPTKGTWNAFLQCIGKLKDKIFPPKQKDKSISEGCRDTAGNNLCLRGEPKTKPGMYYTQVISYYYNPVTRKCESFPVGVAPFHNLKQCQKCCEKKVEPLERIRDMPWV